MSAQRRRRAGHPPRVMSARARRANVPSVRSRNWMWGVGVLVVWAGMMFAFLLIAISRG